MGVPPNQPGANRGTLSALFLLQGIAMASWFVPLSPLLDAAGYGGLRPFAFATTAVAALVTPLLFGAVADRHAPPVTVLRWISFATGTLLTLAAVALDRHWPPWVILGFIQAQALVSIPTWSLLTSIVLAQLSDAKTQFGPIRAFGTFGWMLGCLLVSGLDADASTRAVYTSAAMWIGFALFTRALPSLAPPPAEVVPTLVQRFGLDALALLRLGDHRVVFISSALLAIPLSAFYPYTPSYLRDLGLEHTSAWMSVAQITEAIAMFGMSWLLGRWRLKWILGAGLMFAFLRYALFSTGDRHWVLAGVSLHGLAYTLFFITIPIYLNERIDPAWRTRAQALLSLMTSGVGSLLGYLGTGWWMARCRMPEGIRWRPFWAGLALLVGLVAVYFLIAYRGRARGADQGIRGVTTR